MGRELFEGLQPASELIDGDKVHEVLSQPIVVVVVEALDGGVLDRPVHALVLAVRRETVHRLFPNSPHFKEVGVSSADGRGSMSRSAQANFDVRSTAPRRWSLPSAVRTSATPMWQQPIGQR
jgi:hypothetical protein